MEPKKNSRDKILSTAKHLFQIQGYHGTGINQIIKESGAPKGSLYYYFPNGKEEIAIAAIESVRRSVHQEILDLLASYDSVNEAINAQIRQVASKITNLEETEFRICLIALESVNISEGIREACKKTFDDWISLTRDFLIDKGYPEKRAEETSILVHILIEGAITMCITYEDDSYFDSVVKKIASILESI